MANSVMDSSLPKVRGSRKLLYTLSYLIAIGTIWIVGYCFFQTKYYESLIQKEQTAISDIDTDINTAMKNDRYVKYAAAKDIIATHSFAWRWDRLSRIMNVFAKLQQLGWANVHFSDFSVDFSSLTLKWTVSDLKLVYGKWWVIDQFNELEFLKTISIPDYKKTDDGYTFSLVADVVLQNVSN